MDLSNFNLFTTCGDMESTSEDGKADEGKLHVKRQEMDKGKVRARFIHLLLALCPPHLSLLHVTNIFVNRSSTGCQRVKAVLLSPRPDRALSILWTSKYVPLSASGVLVSRF